MLSVQDHGGPSRSISGTDSGAGRLAARCLGGKDVQGEVGVSELKLPPTHGRPSRPQQDGDPERTHPHTLCRNHCLCSVSSKAPAQSPGLLQTKLNQQFHPHTCLGPGLCWVLRQTRGRIFFNAMFTEHLLCARRYAKHWDFRDK